MRDFKRFIGVMGVFVGSLGLGADPHAGAAWGSIYVLCVVVGAIAVMWDA